MEEGDCLEEIVAVGTVLASEMLSLVQHLSLDVLLNLGFLACVPGFFVIDCASLTQKNLQDN